MLAFASNTLIFSLVGVVIAENIIREMSDAKNTYSAIEWFYMVALYMGINVIRYVTLAFFVVIHCKLRGWILVFFSPVMA